MAPSARRRKEKGANLIDGNGNEADAYWEMEKVLDRRFDKKKRHFEYLIRWKGCPESDNSWEPSSNLCDTGMADTIRFNTDKRVGTCQNAEDHNKKGSRSRRRSSSSIIPPKRVRGKQQKETTRTTKKVKVSQTKKKNNQKYFCPSAQDLRNHQVQSSVDHLRQWTDEEQVPFANIERINVNDTDAKKRITDARINGVPVVLIGHIGWANFTKNWLCPDTSAETTCNHPPLNNDSSETASSSASLLDSDSDMDTNFSDTDTATSSEEGALAMAEPLLLDLSKPHKLDIARMIEDIGSEDIPVVRRNYKETNPIHKQIPAAQFLQSCWPSSDRSINNGKNNTKENNGVQRSLYLHQWQFPLSEIAGRKLCHQNNPLPNNILGEDLLKYWLDLQQCKSDSPLQYLFMGRQDTMSKLHRDSGGLAISIAPIVGKKECVLVHRNDGATCLYHLDANLNDIDLHAFPLMAQARVWKTTVCPGEILLMPHGTYHQCRNVTPCLSYSRFHLDTVNLFPFFQSMIDGDAPEIEHDEVLWNCTSELVRKLDKFVDRTRAQSKSQGNKQGGTPMLPLMTDQVNQMVDTLRSLRNIIREVARRIAVKNAVKGGKIMGRPPPASPASGAVYEFVQSASDLSKGDADAENSSHACESHVDKAEHDFNNLVEDVDLCLHDFRYRHSKNIPEIRLRKVNHLNNSLLEPAAIQAGLTKGVTSNNDTLVGELNEDYSFHVVAYDTDLERAFLCLPRVVSSCFITDPASLAVGNDVIARFCGKMVDGSILKVESQMEAAYLSYEDYPAFYDEFQSLERLRIPGTGAEVRPEDVKAGLAVLNKWGTLGDEYRAVVQHTIFENMFYVQLRIGTFSIERWLTCSSILKKKSPE